jgi:hypothetical protein
MVDIVDAVLYERFERATRALEQATKGALTMSTVGTVTDRTPLRTLLGDHPTTHALRHGMLTSPILPLAFADVAIPHKAFKRVVREVEFDVAEIALMTLLMAQSRGVPLKLMPVVVFSRNPLRHLVCDRERRPFWLPYRRPFLHDHHRRLDPSAARGSVRRRRRTRRVGDA